MGASPALILTCRLARAIFHCLIKTKHYGRSISHPPPSRHHHHPLHQIGTSSLKCGDVGFIIPGNPLNVLESVARGITVTLQLAKRRTLNLNLEGCIASVVSVQQPRPSVILINKTPLKSLCICFSLHVGPALFLDNLVNLDNNSKAIKGGGRKKSGDAYSSSLLKHKLSMIIAGCVA